MSTEYFRKRKGVKQVVPHTQTIGTSETINSQSVTVLEKDSSSDILRATWTVTITNWGSGYAKGCTYIETDFASWSTATYSNIWTTTSCLFVLVSWIKQVTVTTAQVLALNTTAIELIPAPWAWKYIVIDRINASIDFVVAAYATNLTMEFRYWTATTKVSADIASLLAATADKVQSVWGLEAELAIALNDNLEVNVATGDPVTWDSDVKINVQYRILSI